MKRGVWLLKTSPLLFACNGFTANLQKVFETRARHRDAETTRGQYNHFHPQPFAGLVQTPNRLPTRSKAF